MFSTTTPFGQDFYKDLVAQAFKTMDDGTRAAYRILWNILVSFLAQHWLLVTIVLVVVLALSFLCALTGRWGWFGSVLYNYLYFGTLFVVGLIWGPEVFASDYVDIALFVLYVICFLCVGWILSKTGVRRRY